jgi:hypothetical protein
VERGSTEHGPRADDRLDEETGDGLKSNKEAHREDGREREGAGPEPEVGHGAGSGHRIAGSGSSADEYSYKNHGEEGGASHPKPRD